MSDDTIGKIREIFVEAMERDPADRMAYVDAACREDPGMLTKLRSMIDLSDEASGFFERPAWSPLVRPAAEEHSGAAAGRAEPDVPYEKLGDFRLIRRLGEGGMGVVYLALQESLGRHVALKVLRPERIGSFEAVKRFWREVEAVSRLRHPNIVAVHASGEDRGVCYFAMELVPGSCLKHELRRSWSRGEKISTKRALRWIEEIAGALDHAHKAGIIHRDVKPSNILIELDGRARLMDFGVARSTDHSTMTLTGEFRGTPHYAAPEQVKARPRGIDGRADIYSLGATLYELVTGRVPFDGETTEQVFLQILEEEPLPPCRLNPALSRDLQTVVLTAMEKDPDRRYQTMADFADDISRLIIGRVIKARPPGLTDRLRKRFRRNPAAGLALAAAIFILIVSAGYLFGYSYPEIRNQRDQALRMQRESERHRKSAEAEKERALLAQAAAREAEDRARAQASIAEEMYDEVVRLSDIKQLANMEEAAGELWPAFPGKSEAMKEWLHEAGLLIERLGTHSEALAALEAEAGTGGVGVEAEPVFATTEMEWRHGILQELVAGIESLSDAEAGTLTSMRNRLRIAETVREDSLGRYAKEWDRAVRSIADQEECPWYGGFVMAPQIGLVPIGQDRDSRLWEFVHIQTGEAPERGLDGKFVLTEGRGPGACPGRRLFHGCRGAGSKGARIGFAQCGSPCQARRRTGPRGDGDAFPSLQVRDDPGAVAPVHWEESELLQAGGSLRRQGPFPAQSGGAGELGRCGARAFQAEPQASHRGGVGVCRPGRHVDDLVDGQREGVGEGSCEPGRSHLQDERRAAGVGLRGVARRRLRHARPRGLLSAEPLRAARRDRQRLRVVPRFVVQQQLRGCALRRFRLGAGGLVAQVVPRRQLGLPGPGLPIRRPVPEQLGELLRRRGRSSGDGCSPVFGRTYQLCSVNACSDAFA